MHVASEQYTEVAKGIQQATNSRVPTSEVEGLLVLVIMRHIEKSRAHRSAKRRKWHLPHVMSSRYVGYVRYDAFASTPSPNGDNAHAHQSEHIHARRQNRPNTHIEPFIEDRWNLAGPPTIYNRMKTWVSGPKHDYHTNLVSTRRAPRLNACTTGCLPKS